jgi:ribosomal protein L12E/L44/L45/RPP1/RPP2
MPKSRPTETAVAMAERQARAIDHIREGLPSGVVRKRIMAEYNVTEQTTRNDLDRAYSDLARRPMMSGRGAVEVLYHRLERIFCSVLTRAEGEKSNRSAAPLFGLAIKAAKEVAELHGGGTVYNLIRLRAKLDSEAAKERLDAINANMSDKTFDELVDIVARNRRLVNAIRQKAAEQGADGQGRGEGAESEEREEAAATGEPSLGVE